MKKLTVIIALLALAAFPVLAGEWHTGQSNLCADCHTMHNSMAHTWTGTGTVSVGTAVADGNWVKAGATGGGNYLLKAADPNSLCLSCHNGTVNFAPSVLAAKSVNDAANRSAGFLNDGGALAHTGHSLGSAATAPGGTFAALAADGGLACINCHTQHGRAGVYRNLGPRSGPVAVPTYAMAGKQPVDMTGLPTDLAGSTAHATVDVFINAPGYVPNSGNAFAPLYETGNISYLKRTAVVGGIENASGTQCATCHGSFHGAPADATIGGEVNTGTNAAGFVHFNRHPVGGVVLGGTKTSGSRGGYSPIATDRYSNVLSLSRVKVYADDQTTFLDATPGCISCHKGHGNDQPFGLIFANRLNGGMTENGNLPVPTNGATTAIAQRGLCGQCHAQGN